MAAKTIHYQMEIVYTHQTSTRTQYLNGCQLEEYAILPILLQPMDHIQIIPITQHTTTNLTITTTNLTITY